jgi:hypothetical protein
MYHGKYFKLFFLSAGGGGKRKTDERKKGDKNMKSKKEA